MILFGTLRRILFEDKKRPILISLVLFIFNVVQAQSQWGKGILVGLNDDEKYEVIADIPVYRSHLGTEKIGIIQIGGLTFSSDLCEQGWCLSVVELECLVPTIVFFEEREGALSVFIPNSKSFAWILKKDLEKNGWGTKYYSDVTEIEELRSHSSRTYFPVVPLYLRKGPGKEFETVVKMPRLVKVDNEPVFEIRPLVKGPRNWLKVEVKQYSQADCLNSIDERKLIKVYEGWLKAVDEATGSPHIWFDLCCEWL